MFRIGVVLLGGLALVAMAAAYFVRQVGLSADRTPGRVETVIARNLVRLSIPAAQAAAVNPLQHDTGAWRQGRTLFDSHCAVCHGTDARGATPIGTHTYPPVPDLTAPAIATLQRRCLVLDRQARRQLDWHACIPTHTQRAGDLGHGGVHPQGRIADRRGPDADGHDDRCVSRRSSGDRRHPISPG